MWTPRILLPALLPTVCHSFSGQLAQEPLVPQTGHHHNGKPVLKDGLVDWHKTFTSVESITYNEKKCGDWLVWTLEDQGYTVEKQDVDRDAGRFNVYAYPGKTRKTKLLVSGHYDTVPPFYPYKHNGTTISGRGSVDDKASVAAQLVAVNTLISESRLSKDDVGFLFVVGEEVGGDGMRKANDLGLKPQIVVFGEPTEGKLVSGHKGNLGLMLRAKGKAAHSGYPWLGRSANEVLTKALAALMELAPNLPSSEKYGHTTINLGRIEGGVAANVVAESASANIAVRLAGGTPDEAKREMTKAVHLAVESFLDKDTKASDVVELQWSSGGYGTIEIDHDVPGFDVFTVNYGTDIPWLEKAVKGQKRYLYGPGSILVAHSDHEALTEEELFGAVDGYEKLIEFAMKQLDA